MSCGLKPLKGGYMEGGNIIAVIISAVLYFSDYHHYFPLLP